VVVRGRELVNRLELVELIEGELAKLSPEGRDLAEKMELLAHAPQQIGERALYNVQYANAEELLDLSPRDRNLIERLQFLWAGLAESGAAAGRGESGEPHRNKWVIFAAQAKDRGAGRQIDPDMTPEQAVARLKEGG
jgi:hypothetical protein